MFYFVLNAILLKCIPLETEFGAMSPVILKNCKLLSVWDTVGTLLFLILYYIVRDKLTFSNIL